MEHTVKISMVGDLLIHEFVSDTGLDPKTNSYNFDHIFSNISQYVSKSDLSLINQEILLTANNPDSFSYFRKFNNHINFKDSIINSNFNIILHSTNHSYDFGPGLLITDINQWNEKYPNIPIIGCYTNLNNSQKIFIKEIKGIKIAILNFTKYTNVKVPQKNRFLIKFIEDDFLNDLKKTKEMGAEFIIVTVHWGKEYSNKINEFQNEYSKIFIENGVDLVIGTHPHVIQPVKKFVFQGKKSFIFYSLGNFVNSTKRRGENVYRQFCGGMADVEIKKNRSENKVEIVKCKFVPLVTHIYEEVWKGITVFNFNDYSKELAKNNVVGKEYSSMFNYENVAKHFRKVVGKEFLELKEKTKEDIKESLKKEEGENLGDYSLISESNEKFGLNEEKSNNKENKENKSENNLKKRSNSFSCKKDLYFGIIILIIIKTIFYFL